MRPGLAQHPFTICTQPKHEARTKPFWDSERPKAAGPILLKRDIQHGTLGAREHEIALPDAGRQELAGIFAGHLYAFTDLQ
jgi:hypothetical protein